MFKNLTIFLVAFFISIFTTTSFSNDIMNVSDKNIASASVDVNNTQIITNQDTYPKEEKLKELTKIDESINSVEKTMEQQLIENGYITSSIETKEPTLTEESVANKLVSEGFNEYNIQTIIGIYETEHSLKQNNYKIIEDFTSVGSIGFSFANFNNAKIKVIVQKDLKSYIYEVPADGSSQFFPLQFGSGIYQITILENSNNAGFKYLEKNILISATIEKENDVFLNPMQYNNWAQNQEFINLIDEITIGMETEEEILGSIYNYVLDNFKYDYTLAENPPRNYVPDISLLINEKKGICYDYSAIFSAALRYKGIPTKLSKGFSTELSTYHAWNEVFINNKWVLIDTTVDAYYKSKDVPFTMAKEESVYETKYFY